LATIFAEEERLAATSDPDELGRRIRAARERARLSQQELADATGLTKTWIGRLERGTGSPMYETVLKIAQVLPGILRQPDGTFGALANGHGLPMLVPEARLLPVYRWGARGDPTDRTRAPHPDHKEFPAGRESLVGARGFGIVVRGDDLAAFEIRDGDVAWCNPDESAQPGKPAALIVRGKGLVVGVTGEGDLLASLAPVVWVTVGHPPA
jgi:transcriptional regulator with XRE-family HTH domain